MSQVNERREQSPQSVDSYSIANYREELQAFFRNAYDDGDFVVVLALNDKTEGFKGNCFYTVGDDISKLLTWAKAKESKGYGLYYMANQSNGKTKVDSYGKEVPVTENAGVIDKVNRVWLDLDNGVPSGGFDIEPSYVLNTSFTEGVQRVQAVWLLDSTIEHPQQRELITHLIKRYGGDKACKNTNRLLRLPFSLHQKREPQPTILASATYTRYCSTAFNFLASSSSAVEKTTASTAQIVRDRNGRGYDIEKFTKPLATSVKGERDHQLVKTAFYAGGLGVDAGIVKAALLPIWESFGGTEEELVEKFDRCYNDGATRPITTKVGPMPSVEDLYYHCVDVLTCLNFRRTVTNEVMIGDKVLVGDYETLLLGEFRREHGYISAQTFSEALGYVLASNESNRMRDYLLALPELDDACWSGTNPLEELFDNVLTDRQEIEAMLFTRWLVGSVKRWLHPGLNQELILLLIGGQNIGKTKFLRALMPSFGTILDDGLPSSPLSSELKLIDNWDENYRKIRCSHLIVLDEIGTSFRKADIEAFKSMISQVSCEIRLMRRNPYSIPVHWVFAGTSNNFTPLVDTENRRFATLDFTEQTSCINFLWFEEPSKQPGMTNRDALMAFALKLARDKDYRVALTAEEGRRVTAWNTRFTANETTIDAKLAEAILSLETTNKLGKDGFVSNAALIKALENNHVMVPQGKGSKLFMTDLRTMMITTFKAQYKQKTAARGYIITDDTKAVIRTFVESSIHGHTEDSNGFADY
jgi:hypothetical protein